MARAELDLSLPEVFHPTGLLDQLQDHANSRCVLVGRTGTGKTALLVMLRNAEKDRAIWINPKNVALHYLQSVNIKKEADALGLQLKDFYPFLWKQVITFEILSRLFHPRDNRLRGWFRRAWFRLRSVNDAGARATLEFASRIDPGFWQRWHVVSKTEGKKQSVLTQLGLKPSAKVSDPGIGITIGAGVDAGAQSQEEYSEGVTMEAVLKGLLASQDIAQFEDAFRVLRSWITREYGPFFVILDDLDFQMGETRDSYAFLAALVAVASEFAVLSCNCKIVLSIRDDVAQRIRGELAELGLQSDKLDDIRLNLRWSREQLHQLAERRLRPLVSEELRESFRLDDVLPTPDLHTGVVFSEYLLTRTFPRPRDVIGFLNRCIRALQDQGSDRLSWEFVRTAEFEFSHERLTWLQEEWMGNLGELAAAFDALRRLTDGFHTSTLTDDRLGPAYKVGEESMKYAARKHWLVVQCWDSRFSKELKPVEVAALLLKTLYQTGAVGYQVESQPVLYAPSHLTLDSHIPLRADVRWYVHPALHRALGIRRASAT